MNILKCEFECIVDGNNVVRYNILEGAKPDNPIDFGNVWKKAKTVAKKWEAVTKVPENVENELSKVVGATVMCSVSEDIIYD